MRILTTILFIILIQLFQAQQWNSSRILHEIQKLNTLGNVLYLAAHPDDENTRFISYCANEKKMHTGYLSLTRGDGGQNLIGTEIREELGILRTQELLSARSVDGENNFLLELMTLVIPKIQEKHFKFGIRIKYCRTWFG